MLTIDARNFARAAHAGQVRKYVGGPYVQHPERMAAWARSLGLSDEAIAAAYLHDVVEDCAVTIDEVRTMFGERVAFLVEGMTDRQTPADGNRAKRKARERERIASIRDAELHTLKLLDLADNAASIMVHDAGFGPVFAREAVALADALDLGHPKARAALVAVLAEPVEC